MKVYEFVIEKDNQKFKVQVTSNTRENAKKWLLKSEKNIKIIKEL